MKFCMKMNHLHDIFGHLDAMFMFVLTTQQSLMQKPKYVVLWDFVEPPEDKNIVRSKWIFKPKRKADGSVDRYTARLVLQGCTQWYGLDFEEIFCQWHATIQFVSY